MARTQAQREQEFEQRKQQVLQELTAAQTTLEAVDQSLKDKYYPSSKKFQNWALSARAADPQRAINAKEFLKDFFKELVLAMDEHKELIAMGDQVIKDWEAWFQSIEGEDLASLESLMDQNGVAASALPTI